MVAALQHYIDRCALYEWLCDMGTSCSLADIVIAFPDCDIERAISDLIAHGLIVVDVGQISTIK